MMFQFTPNQSGKARFPVSQEVTGELNNVEDAFSADSLHRLTIWLMSG
jgi:hypothetical protein